MRRFLIQRNRTQNEGPPFNEHAHPTFDFVLLCCHVLRANGPELSCGGEAPQRRNPVRAWQVMFNSS